MVVLATVLVLLIAFWWFHLVGLAAERRVTARTESRALVCRVPRAADNRWLQMVIEGYTSHLVQLDGEAAPITHRLEISEHFAADTGCQLGDPVEAYCEVTYLTGKARDRVNLMCR